MLLFLFLSCCIPSLGRRAYCSVVSFKDGMKEVELECFCFEMKLRVE
jgi:hypothetical protein